jgi:hypothetical protein
MSVNTYKKKIEAYIANKESTAKTKDGEGAKGLLAPKSSVDRKIPANTEQDSLANIGDFIYALRQKRQEFKMKKNKEAK